MKCDTCIRLNMTEVQGTKTYSCAYCPDLFGTEGVETCPKYRQSIPKSDVFPKLVDILRVVTLCRAADESTPIRYDSSDKVKYAVNTQRNAYLDFLDIIFTDFRKGNIYLLNYIHTIEPFMFYQAYIPADPSVTNCIDYTFLYPYGIAGIYIKVRVASDFSSISLISYHEFQNMDIVGVFDEYEDTCRYFSEKEQGISLPLNAAYAMQTPVILYVGTVPVHLDIFKQTPKLKLPSASISTFENKYYHLCAGTISDIVFRSIYGMDSFDMSHMDMYDLTAVASLESETLNEHGMLIALSALYRQGNKKVLPPAAELLENISIEELLDWASQYSFQISTNLRTLTEHAKQYTLNKASNHLTLPAQTTFFDESSIIINSIKDMLEVTDSCDKIKSVIITKYGCSETQFEEFLSKALQ